jgi:beta-mannanase
VITGAPTTDELNAFRQITGAHVTLDEYYARWGKPFNAAIASALYSAGALPLVSWEPFTATPASIAAGDSDSYITSYAQAVAAYRKPIAISFAAEMNGTWETWGPPNNTPAQYIAAWRHVHHLFAEAGARNVTWIWAPAPLSPKSRPFHSFYPGDSYVDWIGLDEFWWNTEPKSFDWLLGPSIARLRLITAKPLLITETAGVPGAKVMAVNNLFQGVENTPGIIGFVWFNVKAQRDWSLENDSDAIAAFRRAAKGFS